MPFTLTSSYQPAGDQPQAIETLSTGLTQGIKNQVLLGVTGSGKTYTVASVIAKCKRPTLVIAHNKTLAAQLAAEFRSFFPQNAVHYFVSYYDYYQPEAYLPHSDTYIEKDSSVNEEIDRLRNAATHALLTRQDVIIVASVSCIYGLGNPERYDQYHLHLAVGQAITQRQVMERLVTLRYERNDIDLARGRFRLQGEVLDIMPGYGGTALRIHFFGDTIEQLSELDPVTGSKGQTLPTLDLFPATHFLADSTSQEQIIQHIRRDLTTQLTSFTQANKLLEAQRLKQRTEADLEYIAQTGYCNGIENYSLYFDGRTVGQPPATLIDYFRYTSRRKNSSLLHPTASGMQGVWDLDPPGDPGSTRKLSDQKTSKPDDWLLVIDESHQTIPQIKGMFEGDKARKDALVNYGFRLPTARDNRPLTFAEFESKMPQVIFTSATPGQYELVKISDHSPLTVNSQLLVKGQRSTVTKPQSGLVEMIVRPTGLLDPIIELQPTEGQIDHLLSQIKERVQRKERVLITTLTKRMAEDLTEHLLLNQIKVQYLHSDVETLERIEILRDLRLGIYDVIVGINLLREGLDLPEVSLVAILDADKEGFLRSETALIQTFGRAARHLRGKVILYGDTITGAMAAAMRETDRRRAIQTSYNLTHHITPTGITKNIEASLKRELNESLPELTQLKDRVLPPEEKTRLLRECRLQMDLAAKNLEFEKAALLRDQIRQLQRLKTAKLNNT